MSDKIDEVIASMGWDLDPQEWADMRRLCEAALAQQPEVAVPEGWKLVPIKPSIEMVEAGYETSLGQPDRSGHARTIEVYDAMLAAATAAPVAQEPVAWRVSAPEEPEIGHWLSEEPGTSWQLSEPLYTAPPAAEQPDADDLVVWRITLPSGESCHFGTESMAKAWGRGSGKIERVDLKARPALELVAAEQPDSVKVPRDLLADLVSQDHDTRIQAERRLYALLAGGVA